LLKRPPKLDEKYFLAELLIVEYRLTGDITLMPSGYTPRTKSLKILYKYLALMVLAIEN